VIDKNSLLIIIFKFISNSLLRNEIIFVWIISGKTLFRINYFNYYFSEILKFFFKVFMHYYYNVSFLILFYQCYCVQYQELLIILIRNPLILKKFLFCKNTVVLIIFLINIWTYKFFNCEFKYFYILILSGDNFFVCLKLKWYIIKILKNPKKKS